MTADDLFCARVHDSRQLVDLEYNENAGITEETVKELVLRQLQRDGYSAKKNLPRAKGPDIEGWSYGSGGVLVEAKGEGSRPEMFYSFFVSALGQVVLRFGAQCKRYIVAIPIHEKYVKLVQKVSRDVRQRLNLEFWLIGTQPTRFSIHIIYPDTPL